jgi:curved DNA-binding protein CbpA
MSSLTRSGAPGPGVAELRTYYQLLGISRDEHDPGVIEEAALRRSSQVRPYQLTREPECTATLNEIALALSTLLDPDRRRDYDRLLAGSSATCDVRLVYRGTARRAGAARPAPAPRG